MAGGGGIGGERNLLMASLHSRTVLSRHDGELPLGTSGMQFIQFDRQ